MNTAWFKTIKRQDGQLLLELLLVIGVVAVVGGLVAQTIFASLRADRWASAMDDATALVEEAAAAVDAAAFENWRYLRNPPDGSGDAVAAKGEANRYRPIIVGGSWRLVGGEETLAQNGRSYSRYLIINNVCRDNASRAIAPCGPTAKDDPSTQEVVVRVAWNEGQTERRLYLTRWRNRTCVQTGWSGSGAGPAACPSNLYESAANLDTTGTPGSLKLKAQ